MVGTPTKGYTMSDQPPPTSYAAAPPITPAAPAPRTNTLAIISFVSALVGFFILPFIASVAAVITGHISLKQLKTSGERGHGLALSGTIIGWVGIGLAILGVILIVVIVALAVGSGSVRYGS